MFRYKQKPSMVMTDKVVDISALEEQEMRTPWKSIIVASTFTFCTAAQFTLYFSSLFPYLESLDETANEKFYGYIVAIYSLGQIMSGPVVGYWATKTKSIVSPCHACLTLTLIGNIIYVLAALMPSGQKWGILIGRFFVGMGESSLSLYQGFASTASRFEDRSKALSITTGGLALGFCVGPALQLFFTPIGKGWKLIDKLSFSMYTAPAITCCVINVICMIVLRLVFEEKYAGLANPQAKNAAEKKVKVPPYDRLAVFMCHATRFIQLFAFTNLETIGSPFMMQMFALNAQTTVQYLSVAHSISGFIGFIIYMSHTFLKIDQKIDYRKVCLLGFLGFLLFHLVTFPWPFSVGNLKTYSAEDYESYKKNNGTEPVGCPKDVFDWCLSTGSVNFWVYMVFMVLVLGVFWPNVNVSLSTILSKVLGPRRQANQQSIFQMSASVARFFGPIAISNIYTETGPMYAWLLEITVLVLILLVWLTQYKRFIPLEMPPEQKVSTIIAPPKQEGSDSSLEEDLEDKDAHNYGRF